jgi:hypothetical protein
VYITEEVTNCMSVITYPVFSVVCFMLKHIALISMLCYYMSLHMLQLFAWCDICPLVILNYQTVEMLMLVKFSIRYGFLTCRNF